MENKVKKILQAARDLLAKPGRWTTGYFAVGKDGRQVPWPSPEAHSYCAIGAIRRVAREQGNDTCATVAREMLSKAIGGPVMNWNDQWARPYSSRGARTRNVPRDILQGFDKAIELADKRGN